MRSTSFVVFAVLSCGAPTLPPPDPDAGTPDGIDGGGSFEDAGFDAGESVDAGQPDGGRDAGLPAFDAGPRRDAGGPDDAGSPLTRAFAELRPGDFRRVSNDASEFRVRAPTGTYWIIDWTPRMHWDRATKKIFLLGLRRYHKVSIFDDAVGRWRDHPLPTAWQGLDISGHWYGWGAFDVAGRRIFAKDHVLNVDTETWTGPIAAIPITTNGANGTMLAWQSSVGRLARYGGDAQRWMEYDPATNMWPVVVSTVGNGQHALVEYHPMHNKSLIIGGNNSLQRVQLVDPGGMRRQVANFPTRVSMSGGSWLIPHRSGAWVVRDAPDTGAPHVWAYWADIDQWQDLGESPEDGDNPTAAYDEVEDAVILAHSRGMSVWKCPAIVHP